MKEKVLDKWDDPKFQSRYLENGYMSADTFKKATGEEQAAKEQEAQKQAEAKAKEAETRKKEEAEQSAKTKAEANGLQELLNKKVATPTSMQRPTMQAQTTKMRAVTNWSTKMT